MQCPEIVLVWLNVPQLLTLSNGAILKRSDKTIDQSIDSIIHIKTNFVNCWINNVCK